MNDKTEYANVVTLPSKNILGKIKKDDYEVNLYAGKEIIDFLNNKSYIKNDLNKYNAGKINMISGAFGAQKAYLTSILKNNNSTLIIVPEQKDIFLWNQDIKFFMPEKQVLFFPIMDKVNFEVTYSSTERLRDRVQSLAALYDNKDVVVIASIVEVMQKIPSKINVIQKTWTISLQDEIVRGRILNKLVDLGYERVDQVERVGHFSI
ncbi:MAG: transcription-repair coupling factor, partial [Dialister micraerophilus]|nr:transcription-repair coupling factor [Dialister micraerophilus]